jgi:anti-sigma-K factor RskA
MNYSEPDLQQRLASEYVLGTLHGPARKRFERLLEGDAKLREAVHLWEQELVPMASALSVPAPAPRVWEGIAARVAPPRREVEEPGFFERFFGWRTLGPLVAGLFLGVGVMSVAPLLRDKPEPGVSRMQLPESYAGFLQDGGGNPTMLVSSLRHGKIVDVKVLRPIDVPQDRYLQLWAVPRDKPPFPLGMVPPQGKGSLTMTGTSEELLSQVAELGVSMEAKGAPPGAGPAGPFVLRGPCAKFW